MARIIALCGPKRSGKDTVTNVIMDRLCMTYNMKHVKIADPLKQICKILFQFTDEQLETDMKEEIDPKWGISPRMAMQKLGTDILQYKIEEVLPIRTERQLLVRAMNIQPQSNTIYVVSDMRFPHEYDYLSRICPCKVIRVERPDYTMNDMHASEQSWNHVPYNHKILNDGSINDLHAKVEEILPFII